MNIHLNLPENFLEEEERTDCVVSGKMKRVWAVQLDLLHELEKVCKAHGLQYFADSGTLIGAVRHRGYIPWDDDIDIVMKRKDYDKLIAVGRTAFQEPYFLQSAHSERFPRGYARLRNSESTALTWNDVDMKVNRGIFIDIFPLDNVPDSGFTRTIWLKEIDILSRIISIGTLRTEEDFPDLPRRIAFILLRRIYMAAGYETLVDAYERLCGKYNSIPTKEISYVAYSKGKKKHIWHRIGFDSARTAPFEFLEIPIPVGYDARLRTEYKDYMKIVHASTAHGQTILEPDIPYGEYMRTHSIEELREKLRA